MFFVDVFMVHFLFPHEDFQKICYLYSDLYLIDGFNVLNYNSRITQSPKKHELLLHFIQDFVYITLIFFNVKWFLFFEPPRTVALKSLKCF